MHILVTGASGFLGGFVIPRLERGGCRLTLQGSSRRPAEGPGRRVFQTGPFETFDDWPRLLEGIDVVVNLAGRSRIASETGEAYRAANETGMRRLVDALKAQGVRRLVHISSIAAKVGVDDYGRTKMMGETIVGEWAKTPGCSATIVRPPLIYGPGAPGNMARLVSLVHTGLPLPFASVDNRRSLLSAANAADGIAAAIAAPVQPGLATYELCDDEVVSLPQIIAAIAAGSGKRVRLLPCPASLLYRSLAFLSPHMAEGLFGSLTLDNRLFKERFAWQPAIGTLEGLREIGRATNK